MLLNIIKAKAEPDKQVEFCIDFQLSSEKIEDRGYNILSPIKLHGKMIYHADALSITSVATVKIMFVCDNCGEQFEKTFSFEFNEDFYENYSTHSEEDYLINQVCIEIDKPLEDAFLLSLPSKVLCKENCKGLCSICGKNKNKSDCNCEEVEKKEREFEKNDDSPFTILKK